MELSSVLCKDMFIIRLDQSPVSKRILGQIEDRTKCYKIADTITICRRIPFETGSCSSVPLPLYTAGAATPSVI